MSLDDAIADLRVQAQQERDAAAANLARVEAACVRFSELAPEASVAPDFTENGHDRPSGWLIEATKYGLGGSGPIVVHHDGTWDNAGYVSAHWAVVAGRNHVPDAEELEVQMAQMLTKNDA